MGIKPSSNTDWLVRENAVELTIIQGTIILKDSSFLKLSPFLAQGHQLETGSFLQWSRRNMVFSCTGDPLKRKTKPISCLMIFTSKKKVIFYCKFDDLS